VTTRAEGHGLWERITNKTPDDQPRYYDELLRFFSARREGPLVEDLRHATAELADAAETAHERRLAATRLPVD
jgi:hypothetical protein